MAKEEVYIKGNDSSLINKNNQFVYEVAIFCRLTGYFSLINRAYYVSNKALSIVKTFQYGPHSLMRTYLYSAPLWWLLDEGFIRYTAPLKKVVVKKPKQTKSEPKLKGTKGWVPELIKN